MPHGRIDNQKDVALSDWAYQTRLYVSTQGTSLRMVRTWQPFPLNNNSVEILCRHSAELPTKAASIPTYSLGACGSCIAYIRSARGFARRNFASIAAPAALVARPASVLFCLTLMQDSLRARSRPDYVQALWGLSTAYPGPK